MLSKVKCDTDLVEELMQQHHTMASIMQFWLCKYAGPVMKQPGVVSSPLLALTLVHFHT
jgi:hypothetical protein